MENATDALKMAFAVFIFIMALTVLLMQMTKIKETSDSIFLSTDKTNFYEWTTGNLENGRIVGEETVISTLHNQAKESTYVIIQNERGNIIEKFAPKETKEAKDEKEQFINDNLHKGELYLENITQLTTDGKVYVGEDGTRVTVLPETTQTYIIYKKYN